LKESVQQILGTLSNTFAEKQHTEKTKITQNHYNTDPIYIAQNPDSSDGEFERRICRVFLLEALCGTRIITAHQATDSSFHHPKSDQI